MRNVKKFLALVLAMLMVVSAAATVSAFEDVAEDNLFAEAIADLTVLEIVNGYDGETFGPEDAVTRQQFALMMARAITGIVGDDAVWAQGGLVGFEDVTEYQYAIATVVKAGIVDGFLDNTFRPDEGVTFIQALKMAVAALGYDDGNLDWWQGYYNVALDLGLTENLNQITDADKALNRGEVAQLIWNMLYAPSANGSSLYEDIFAEPVVEPAELTVMAITATNKQFATENIEVAEGGFVGVQEIVNGVPSGDVYYLPIADFGFESDAAAEEAFLDAYAFENWDNGDYDAVYATGAKEYIYSTDITAAAKTAGNLGKLTIGGKNFYMVEEKTDSVIKNEVVVFNRDNTAYVYTDKVLALDEKGKVFDENDVLVLSARFNSKGEIVAYYDYETDTYIDEEQATAKYGIPVKSDYNTHLGVIGKADLGAAYELTAYDDDMDGKMDRAYYTPVYVAVKNGFTDTDKHLTEGPFKGHDDGDNGKITGMEDLAKGDVFVYTYNKALKKVNVLEVLEVKTAVVDYVSTLKLNTYFTIETADDEVLTAYVGGNDAKIGATLKATTTAPAKMADITTDAKFGYVDAKALYEKLQHSMGIKYIERNGVVIYAEAYNIEDTYELVVVKEVADLDIGTFYVDVYLDGVLVELPVVALNNGVKTIDFSKISWLKQANYVDDFVEGGVYKLVELEDGYLLNEILAPADDDSVDSFKLYNVPAVDDKLVIEDNIAALTTVESRASRLRTNANTVWYFINNAGTDLATIKTYAGEIDYGEIPVSETTIILADKLGYTESYKGVATEVYVFNAELADVKGFGINKLTASEVYIPVTSVKYEYDTADVFGLDEAIYTERGYYKYANIGIDVNTGATVTVYSKNRLTEDDVFYSVDHNGVIIDEVTTTMTKATGKLDVTTADTYITMKDGTTTVVKYTDKVTAVYAVEAAKTIAKKSAADAEALIDAATSAYYKFNDKGVLVVIWSKAAAPVDPEKVTVNAKYVVNADTVYAAVAETALAGDTLTVNAYRTKTAFAGYGQADDVKLPVGTLTSIDVNGWWIATDAGAVKYESWNVDNVTATATVKDDVYTITFKMADSMDSAFASQWANLTAGKYKLVVAFDYDGVESAPATNEYTIFFEIEA